MLCQSIGICKIDLESDDIMGIMGKVEKLARWANIWCSQFEAVRMENKKEEPENQSVLVVKLDAIGDFIIWLDSAKEFRNLYPGYHICLMCSAPCVEIAKATGFFDDIRTLNIRRFEGDNAYKKAMLNELHSVSYSVLIQTAYSRTVHMDMIAAAIPAGKKIGLVCDETRTNLSRYITTGANRKKLDAIYDELIPVSDEWLMEVRRNGELIRGLGRKDFQTAMPVLPPTDVKDGVLPKEDYVVLFPGASTPKKMWAPANFAAIADYIAEKTGFSIYLCGGRDEAALYTQIADKARQKENLVDYFGKTSLLELAEVIRHARFVISNDTSGIHFAAATRTPSICILGEYNFGRFLPYDFDQTNDEETNPMIICNANMPCKKCAVGKMTSECRSCMAMTGRYLCVDKVTVAQVQEAVDQILDNMR